MNKQVVVSRVFSMITDDTYDFVRELGSGSFACVSQYQNKQTLEEVAIKHIYVQRGFLPEVMGEVNKLKKFTNDHIIKCKDSFYDSEELYLNIVLQLCQGSLRSQIQQRKTFFERELISFITQMTNAFLDLQKQMVMHLDFKPQNVLIANNGPQNSTSHYKIADFGCAQIAEFSKLSGYQSASFGTKNYSGPQNHKDYKGKKTQTCADVWSLGITLYEMIYWKMPFPTDSDGVIQTEKIIDYLEGKGPGIEFIENAMAPQKIIKLIKEMLRPLPTQRINWDGIKNYLIKELGVEEYELQNIEDAVLKALPILQLFNKVLDTAQKQEKKAVYEALANYLFYVGVKFRYRVGYKFQVLDKGTRARLEKALTGLEEHQRAVNGPTVSEAISEQEHEESPETTLISFLKKNGRQSELVRVFTKELLTIIEWEHCLLREKYSASMQIK